MFPFKFNCNGDTDPLLKQLHATYSATPFLPPSTAVRLLDLVLHRGQNTQHLGPFSEVLEPAATAFEVETRHIKSANIELNKTTHFNLDLGFQLLDGIFKGFDLQMEPLKGVLKGEKEIALSFQNVRRRSVPHTVLGTALDGQRVKLGHSSVRMLRDKKFDAYIVSSVLESKQFSIILDKDGSQNLDLELPSIDALAQAGLEMGGDKKTGLSFTHKGKNYLTFAFSCFELVVQSDGTVFIEKEVNWAKGLDEDDEAAAIEPGSPEVSFMNPRLPAILAWDRLKEE